MSARGCGGIMGVVFSIIWLALRRSTDTSKPILISHSPADVVQKYFALDNKGARLDATSFDTLAYANGREPVWGKIIVINGFSVPDDYRKWEMVNPLEVVIPVEFQVLGVMYIDTAGFVPESDGEQGFASKSRGAVEDCGPMFPPHVGQKRMMNFVRQAMLEETGRGTGPIWRPCRMIYGRRNNARTITRCRASYFRSRRHPDRIEMGHRGHGESDVAGLTASGTDTGRDIRVRRRRRQEVTPTGGGRGEPGKVRRGACGSFVGIIWSIAWTARSFIPALRKCCTHFAEKQKAVATNKSIEYTHVILNGLGPQHFNYVIGGDNGFGLKPEPGMLVHVMKQLGVTKEQTVLVGDSTNDINGGHNAGIRVCAVGYGMGNRQKMAACSPDWFIERPEELMELFT